MRLKLLKILLAFTLLSLLCVIMYKNARNSELLVINNARESFVKIIVENEILMSPCSDQELFSGNCDASSVSVDDYKIFGSGVIIEHNMQNYILTADHICRQMINGAVESQDGKTGVLLSSAFAMMLDGMLYKVDIKKQDEINDICLLDFERSDEAKGIKIHNGNLIPGERVYNLAAPKGVFEPGNVLIFDGFYTGRTATANNGMMFSIYAEQGSSGSAIINNKGELVSIIHSVLTTVDNVAVGSDLNEIKEFLKDE